MKRTFTLLFWLLIFSNEVSSQQTGYNLDFGSGTFDGWVGGTGYVTDDKMKEFKIVKNRHTIMNENLTDINTCDMIEVLPPGAKFSARLGNDKTGKQAESLSYALAVSESNSLFIYKYAVVLQDPGHVANEQPYFKISVYNEKRELIDPACGVYNVSASENIPGFQKCDENSVVYKDWTTVGLDLSPYIGQIINIEFETGDCTHGGHYGYAYVQAFSSSLKINSSYCVDANGANLSAPLGFFYLWDTGETTQTIKIDNPIEGKIYSCELTSVTGCKVNISTVLTLKVPEINFEVSNTCDKQEVVFKNTTLNNNSTENTFQWDFGDGTTDTNENPNHKYASTGNYNVTFTFSNSLGCKYTMTKPIVINPTPEPILTGGTLCLDSNGKLVSSFILDCGLSNSNLLYAWYLNDEQISGEINSKYAPTQKGVYTVLVTDITTGCNAQAFATVLESIIPSDFKTNISEAFAENSFIDINVIGGTGPFFYQLDDNDFQSSNIFNEIASGDHSITIKDDSNCTFLSKEITILDYPKFFTPNNDGYNDFWNIQNFSNFSDAQISIFDKFGKFLKKMTPSGKGWDGLKNGIPMPSTDYWFVLHYSTKTDSGNLEVKTFKSHFSLKR